MDYLDSMIQGAEDELLQLTAAAKRRCKEVTYPEEQTDRKFTFAELYLVKGQAEHLITIIDEIHRVQKEQERLIKIKNAFNDEVVL